MKYVLILLLVVGTVFYGCSKSRQNSEIGYEQQQLFSHVPAGTRFIMYMNISELKSTDYWDEYLSPTLNDYKENFWITGFRETTDLAIENYISDFLMASLDTERSIKVYKFNSGENKIKSYLNDNNYFNRISEGTFIYYEALQNPGSYFLFHEPSLLITFNWKAGLENYLNKKYKPLKYNNDFINIIEQISNKKKYWMATDRGSFASAMMRKIAASDSYKQVIKVLSKVNSITLEADFSGSINVESVWGCNDPASSGLIAAAARSAIAMDLFSDKEYALGKIMDKVSVETDASDVVFKINLDKSDIKELKNIAEKRNFDKKL